MKLSAEQVLASMPPWWFVNFRWAVSFVLHGPRWVPAYIRRVPLRLACAYTMAKVARLHRGDGGYAPHGKP